MTYLIENINRTIDIYQQKVLKKSLKEKVFIWAFPKPFLEIALFQVVGKNFAKIQTISTNRRDSGTSKKNGVSYLPIFIYRSSLYKFLN